MARLISWYCAMTGEARRGERRGRRRREVRSSASGHRQAGEEGGRERLLTVACGSAEHERRIGVTEDRRLSGDPRGGRLVSRPRAFSQRRLGAAGRRVRAERPFGPRVARFAGRGRRDRAAAPKIVPAGLTDEIKYIAPLTDRRHHPVVGRPDRRDRRRAGRRRPRRRGIEGAVRRLHRRAAQRGVCRGAERRGGLLWVRCEDSERELTATRILEEAGGHHVHVHGRPSR